MDIHDNANVTFNQSTNGNYTGAIYGQRQPDQERGRHADPDRRQQLYRRHHGQPRHARRAPPTSLKGDIHDNANVTFSQNTNGNYTGSLTGSGSLTKNGNGTVTLLGSNNYGGGTIVNGGTLAGTTVTLQGDILDNANVTFNQSTTGTYSDTISGSGSLTKAGSGTVTLLGDNGYTGGTIITGGSLHGTTVSLQGDIHINASNANVTFDQAVNGSYTNNITGSGSLTKDGGGTLTLLGDNGYTGGTTVSGGTLSGTTVSLDGDISVAAGAHVELDQSAPGTFVGEITGGGSLIKDGTGTVTLSGTNDYSGGTTVDAGILQGTTSSLQGNIFAASGADVTFDQATNGSYTGQLSGSGSLTKSGAGILTLTGHSSYQGGTDVTGGGLSISSDANLGSGGTVALGANTSLAFTAGGTYTHAITVTGDPTFIVGPGLTVTQSGAIADGGGTPGVVEVSGGGTLALTDAANSYSGGTSIDGRQHGPHRQRPCAGRQHGRSDPGGCHDLRPADGHRHAELDPGHHSGDRRRHDRHERRGHGDAGRRHHRHGD